MHQSGGNSYRQNQIPFFAVIFHPLDHFSLLLKAALRRKEALEAGRSGLEQIYLRKKGQ
jgi:hypothetical protein